MAPNSVFEALEAVDISDMTAELPLGPADVIKHGKLPNGMTCVRLPNSAATSLMTQRLHTFQ